MEQIFLKLVNLSINASWSILAVILLRLLLKKAPKWMSCFLWIVVGIRLIFPFSLESSFSLLPSAEAIPPTILSDSSPAINSGINIVNSTVNPMLSQLFTPEIGASANPLQVFAFIVSSIWIAGIIIMLLYAAVSYLRLKYKLRSSTPMYDNIRQSDMIACPFVFGIIRPTIYLPYQLEESNLDFIIAHEQTHIKRLDHWLKPIAFFLLTVYWFNPLVWIAYICLCRDIELACDEKVVKDMKSEERKAYSKALVLSSTNHHMIVSCPLAFGEVGVKERVKNVMHYKKPSFWIVLAAVAVCIITAVCFLTSPKTHNSYPKHYTHLGEYEPVPLYVLLENETDFQFIYSYFSSYLPYGKYTIEDDTLILKTNDGLYTYTFQIDGDTLIFDQANSSSLPTYKYSADSKKAVPPFEDGARFRLEHN